VVVVSISNGGGGGGDVDNVGGCENARMDGNCARLQA